MAAKKRRTRTRKRRSRRSRLLALIRDTRRAYLAEGLTADVVSVLVPHPDPRRRRAELIAAARAEIAAEKGRRS
jgi:hypothetical protein